MTNAIFVSLSRLYSELAPSAQQNKNSAALRDITCAWWVVKPASAAGVQYVFGVFKGAVVSAYGVNVPASGCRVMPGGAIAAGRRYIHATDLTARDWTTATNWRGIVMNVPLQYGTVSLDNYGAIAGYVL